MLDPRSGEEVSMQQAIMLGIINNREGTYVNPDTGIAVPIPEAMNQGNIKVCFIQYVLLIFLIKFLAQCIII